MSTSKLLLIDDSKIFLNLLKNELNAHLTGDFEIDTAIDTDDAFEMITKNDYALIITDVLMPKLTGIQLIQKMQDQGIKAESIVITSLHDKQTMTELEALNVKSIFNKPLNFKDLASKTMEVLAA
jgi:two-component system response regulator YesN